MAHGYKQTIPHEEKVRAVVDNQTGTNRAVKTTNVVRATSTVGTTYNQTEITALKTAIEDLRAAVIAAGVAKAS